MTTPTRTPLTAEQEAIGNALRSAWDARKTELKLTQVEAAKALKMTQGAFTQYLNKHIAANTEFVLKLCQLLKVDPASIHAKFKDVHLASAGIMITNEWDKPLKKPVPLDIQHKNSALFGIRVAKGKTPYPDSAVLLCVRKVEPDALGYIMTDKEWRWTERYKAKDKGTVLSILGALIA